MRPRLADRPGGHGQRGLVGVGLAIGAGVAVLAEQAGPAEGQGLGVEQRQVVLHPVGHAQVVEARLQRLHVVVAEQRGLALEQQAGVDAADRGAAVRAEVGALRQHPRITLERVAGLADGEFRVHEPARATEVEAYRRLHVEALAAGQFVVLEAHGFGHWPRIRGRRA
jgi:hypothetical protein